MEINNYLLKKEYDKKIVNKYSVPWCFTNHDGHEKEHFFQFPEDEQQRKTLLKFLNCSDAQEFKHVLVCAIHFSDHVINKNEKRFLLIKKLKHVPLIVSPSQMFLMGLWDNQSTAKTYTKARIFKEDQLEEFKKSNSITSLDYFNEKQMKS